MNYDDELERAQARRNRRRESGDLETMNFRESVRNGSVRTTHGESMNSGTNRSSASQTNRSTTNGARTKYRRKKKKSDKIKKILLGILILLVLAIGGAALAAYLYVDSGLDAAQEKQPFNKEEVVNPNISVEQKEKMEKGFWTVAVFGVDSRDNSLGKGNQSDVIMIANLNRKTGEIKLVSVFRDTYLNINDRNTYNKINAAYATAGPEGAVKALNKNLDLNITHYATFNWKAVATVINILGGVEIDISPAEFHYINAFITETVKGTGIGSVQLPHAGVHNLDGVQAVAYGRLRLMDSDYARTERQRIVIKKAFEKVKTADLATLNSVVGHVFEMSATNIEFGDLAGLVKDVAKYHLGETTGFPAARGEARIKIGQYNQSCVIPQTLVSNVSSLHNFLFGEENYDPSASVKEISNEIAYISGLANEAKEIGSVAVDQGYIPKETTAASTKAEESEVETQESESETEEPWTGEFDPEEPDYEMTPSDAWETLEDGSTIPATGNGDPTAPTNPSRFDPSGPASVPSGPGSETSPSGPSGATGPGYRPSGPGSDPGLVPEATQSPIVPGQTQENSVTVPGSTAPTAASAAETTEAPTTAPSGPADAASSAAP